MLPKKKKKFNATTFGCAKSKRTREKEKKTLKKALHNTLTKP